MPINATQVLAAAARWGIEEVTAPVADKLADYGNLLLHWNARLSLTSIRDEAELIERHLMEGVFAAAHHPPATSVLDFGSGTGVPGIVIAVYRQTLQVTLAESQRKKAAFLQEAVRRHGLNSHVHADRAESLPAGSFDAVWMRAVDRSAVMLPSAATLVAPGGFLCLFGTTAPPIMQGPYVWVWKSHALPGANTRVLHIGART